MFESIMTFPIFSSPSAPNEIKSPTLTFSGAGIQNNSLLDNLIIATGADLAWSCTISTISPLIVSLGRFG